LSLKRSPALTGKHLLLCEIIPRLDPSAFHEAFTVRKRAAARLPAVMLRLPATTQNSERRYRKEENRSVLDKDPSEFGYPCNLARDEMPEEKAVKKGKQPKAG
jgi:hypothetical protein